MENINDVIRKHAKLVTFTIKKFFPYEVGDEDTFQIGLIGLWEAYKNYDETKGAKFETFAVTCIYNTISNAIRKKLSAKRNENGRIVYDTNDLLAIDLLDENQTPIDFEMVFKEIWDDFNKEERIIVRRKAKGDTDKEIAKDLEISERTVRRRVKNIKDKFKR